MFVAVEALRANFFSMEVSNVQAVFKEGDGYISMTDEQQLNALRAKLDTLAPDCGDNSCAFAVQRGGMRTNGGCRCLSGRSILNSPKIEQWAFCANAYIRLLKKKDS